MSAICGGINSKQIRGKRTIIWTRLLAVAIGLVTQNQSQYHGRGKGTIIIRLVSNRWRADGHYSLLTMVSSMVKAK